MAQEPLLTGCTPGRSVVEGGRQRPPQGPVHWACCRARGAHQETQRLGGTAEVVPEPESQRWRPAHRGLHVAVRLRQLEFLQNKEGMMVEKEPSPD